MENQLERQNYEERATAGNPDDLTIEIFCYFLAANPLWAYSGIVPAARGARVE